MSSLTILYLLSLTASCRAVSPSWKKLYQKLKYSEDEKCKAHCEASAYPVPGVCFGTAGQQILHNDGVACSCGHMQRSAAQLQGGHGNILCLAYLHANPQTKTLTGSSRCKYDNNLKGTRVWVLVHVHLLTKCALTLSLTLRSAPWLFRALTASRLPPLQAQCTALEPSWNTVGEPYSISSAVQQPLEISCVHNLIQFPCQLYKHVTAGLTRSLKLISAPFSRSSWITAVCPSIEAQCSAVLLNFNVKVK